MHHNNNDTSLQKIFFLKCATHGPTISVFKNRNHDHTLYTSKELL